MKDAILGLRTAIYRVTDTNAAKQWYARAFNIQPYFDEPFYVGFDIDGFELGLQPEVTTANHKVECVVAYWGVEDLREAYLHFTTVAGAEPNEEQREVGGGHSVGKVKDHWGNLSGRIYTQHFGNWH